MKFCRREFIAGIFVVGAVRLAVYRLPRLASCVARAAASSFAHLAVCDSIKAIPAQATE